MTEAMVRTAKKASKLLLAALAAVSMVMLITLADCGCGEEQKVKQDAPVEVEQEAQKPTTSLAEKSPSQLALENALEDGKPVFLNFHSNQCIPCIEMEKVIGQVEPEYAGRVEFVVVDVYDRAELPLCDYFQVRVIPTSFFIRPDGTVIDAYEGLIQTDQMRALLDKLISGGGQASPSPQS